MRLTMKRIINNTNNLNSDLITYYKNSELFLKFHIAILVSGILIFLIIFIKNIWSKYKKNT